MTYKKLIFALIVAVSFFIIGCSDKTKQEDNNVDAKDSGIKDTTDDDDGNEKDLYDETCGLHIGDDSFFRSVPALKPIASVNTLGDHPEPLSIHLSWQSDPSISVTAVWQTADESAETMTMSSVLRVSRQSDMKEFIEIDAENTGTMIGAAHVLPYDGDNYKTIHVAEVCGLEPGTKYYYTVGGKDESGKEVFSKVYSFLTAPDPRKPQDEMSFKFVVLGDSRTNYDTWGKIVDCVIGETPDFILHTGDFVEAGGNQPEWEIWFENSKDMLANAPLLGASGNHEWNHTNYYVQFAFPGNEQWYSLNYGNMHLTVLNDFSLGTMGLLGSVSTEQAAFLDDDLALVDRQWKLVMHHQPLYSSGKHGSMENLQEAWGGIYDKYGVNIVFNGHDHLYERTVPIKATHEVDTPQEGTVYFVTGGAGAPLYDTGSEWFTAFNSKENHYMVVEITGKNILIKTKNVDGAIIDSYEYSID